MIALVCEAFQVSQGSVETLFRWSGKRLYHFAANLFMKRWTKFCQNRPSFVEDYRKHFGLFFLDTLYLPPRRRAVSNYPPAAVPVCYVNKPPSFQLHVTALGLLVYFQVGYSKTLICMTTTAVRYQLSLVSLFIGSDVDDSTMNTYRLSCRCSLIGHTTADAVTTIVLLPPLICY